MTPPAVSPADRTAADDRLPPQGVRTFVSFLLFVYLFGLAVGITANESPSALESKLGQVPLLRQLRQALFMDISYTYYLTRGSEPGGELDVDHAITVEMKRADGSTETLVLPPPDMQPRQRRRRYQNLARNLAVFADSGDARGEGLLAEGLAAGFLADPDVTHLTLRCQGHLTPPAMDQFRPDDPGNWTRYRTDYAARALRSGGRVGLLKVEPARDTAPPARGDQ